MSIGHEILVDFQSNNSNLELSSFTIGRGNISAEGEYFNLNFKASLGGGESFLGYSYKHSHADTYRGRLIIECSNKVNVKLSVEDVLQWPITVIDKDTILIAPTICTFE